VFECHAASDHPEIVLILTEPDADHSSVYRSRLFGKHLPDAEYKQQRFGLNFTNAEAGLYDYYTDNLIEKYVLSFDPSDEYWDADARVIRFRLAKDALPRGLEGYVVGLFIP